MGWTTGIFIQMGLTPSGIGGRMVPHGGTITTDTAT